MDAHLDEPRVLHAPLAELELALIATYLHARGFDPDTLALLPAVERGALLTDASVYASARLAEVEARSHYVHDMHE